MKTYSVQVNQSQAPDSIARLKLIPAMKASIREILLLMSTVLVAASIITLSVWVAGMEVNALLGAGTWALGFIYLGFAIDNQQRSARFQVVTGLALMVLALLQNYVSPDFLIVSGTLVAAWVVAILFKRVYPWDM